MKTAYKSIILASLFTIGTLSCAKLEQGVDGQGDLDRVECEIGINLPQTATKTLLGAKNGSTYPILWNKGDIVTVNGCASYPLGSAYKGEQSAVFKFKDTPDAPYNFLYPGIEGVNDKVKFAAVQNYVENSFDNGSCPMYATSDALGGVMLKPLGSALHFSLTGNKKVTKIVVTAPGGEPLSGLFTVSKTDGRLNGELVAVPDSVSSSVTLSMDMGLNLSDVNPLNFYVMVPAGKYSEYFLAQVYDEDGLQMLYEFLPQADSCVVGGKVYSFTTREYDGSFIISSVEDLLAFSKGSTTCSARLIADIDMTGVPYKSFNNFNGHFDGGNHKIKGLTTPLFGSFYGYAKDLVLESNVVYSGQHGDYNSGTDYGIGLFCHYAYNSTHADAYLTNITVSGSLRVTGPTKSAHAFQMGGICGASNGVPLTNCVNKADITLENGFKVAAHSSGSTEFNVFVGGVAGTGQTAATCNITNCRNEGKVSCFAQSVGEYLGVGGVLGYHNKLSTISGCVNTGEVLIGEECYSVKAYNLGGIIGRNTSAKVQNCENKGNVTAQGKSKIFVQIGGIQGYTGNSTSNATDNVNRGNVTADGVACSYCFIGGCAGYDGTSAITGYTNYGEVRIQNIKNSAATGIAIGGCLGQNNSQTHQNSGLKNYGKVVVDALDDNATAGRYDVGGVVGYDYYDSSGKLCSVTNSDYYNEGEIVINSLSTCNILRAGGIVGNEVCGANGTNSSYTISNFVNKGNITVKGECAFPGYVGGIIGDARIGGTISTSNLSNSGDITINANLGGSGATSGNGFGGLIGRSANGVKSLTIKNSENSGSITLVCDGDDIFMPSAGGIVGTIWSQYSQKATITSCTNSGNISRALKGIAAGTFVATGEDYIKYSSCAGGIVGSIGNYMDEKYCTESATITSCTNSGKIQFHRLTSLDATTFCETNQAYNYVWTGGIIGLSYSTSSSGITVKTCSNTGHIASATGKMGGLVGFQRRGTKIQGTVSSYCTNSGLVGMKSADETGTPYGNAGGIVGYMYGDSANYIEYCCNTGSACGNYGGAGLVGQVGSTASPVIGGIKFCKSFGDFKASSDASQSGICFGKIDGALADGSDNDTMKNISSIAVGGRVYWFNDPNWGWVTTDDSNYSDYLISKAASSESKTAVKTAATNGAIEYWNGTDATSWEVL